MSTLVIKKIVTSIDLIEQSLGQFSDWQRWLTKVPGKGETGKRQDFLHDSLESISPLAVPTIHRDWVETNRAITVPYFSHGRTCRFLVA